MPTRDTILRDLRRLSPQLKAKYGVEIVGLFGSRARGDSGERSDIDLAYTIESGKARTLLDVGGAYTDLREALGCEVDMVDWNHVDPRYKSSMERDLVRIDG